MELTEILNNPAAQAGAVAVGAYGLLNADKAWAWLKPRLPSDKRPLSDLIDEVFDDVAGGFDVEAHYEALELLRSVREDRCIEYREAIDALRDNFLTPCECDDTPEVTDAALNELIRRTGGDPDRVK